MRTLIAIMIFVLVSLIAAPQIDIWVGWLHGALNYGAISANPSEGPFEHISIPLAAILAAQMAMSFWCHASKR